MENFKTHSLELKSQIYDIYKSVYCLTSSLQKKCSIMTTVLGGYETSWRVIGITEAALKTLHENQYRYKKATICRAHIVSRIETANQIFNRESPVSLNELFEMVWKNDRTIIATKNENKTGGVLPKYIPIDYRQGLFRCNPVVGFRYSKAERTYLENLYQSVNAGKIVLVNPY